MAIMFAPSTGWPAPSFMSKASAGGQLEQPSEVNNSTTTGWAFLASAELPESDFPAGENVSAEAAIPAVSRNEAAIFIEDTPVTLNPVMRIQTESCLDVQNPTNSAWRNTLLSQPILV